MNDVYVTEPIQPNLRNAIGGYSHVAEFVRCVLPQATEIKKGCQIGVTGRNGSCNGRNGSYCMHIYLPGSKFH